MSSYEGLPEVWRGGVNTWECDEMGHLNVRFYVSITMEALVGLAAELGLPHAFTPGSGTALIVREQHIRYIREARAHTTLAMTAGVVAVTETEAELLFVLTHVESGLPCAGIQMRVIHATADGRAFPWPKGFHQRAAALTTDVPDFAAARTLGMGEVETTASLERADEIGMITLGGGAFGPRDCDVFGRMAPHLFMGRVADGVNQLVNPFRKAVIDHAVTKPERVGGAMLEYRGLHFAWPRAGDRFVIRSGVSGADDKGQRVIHWLLDPATGKPWAVAEAYVITMDLDARKMVRLAPEATKVILDRAPNGIAL